MPIFGPFSGGDKISFLRKFLSHFSKCGPSTANSLQWLSAEDKVRIPTSSNIAGMVGKKRSHIVMKFSLRGK